MVEMTGIKKRFSGVKALDGVELKIRPGEVHALIGENGAGKSTLMKILGGAYTLDEGTIIIEGKEVEIKNPIESAENGIAVSLSGTGACKFPDGRGQHPFGKNPKQTWLDQ